VSDEQRGPQRRLPNKAMKLPAAFSARGLSPDRSLDGRALWAARSRKERQDRTIKQEPTKPIDQQAR